MQQKEGRVMGLPGGMNLNGGISAKTGSWCSDAAKLKLKTPGPKQSFLIGPSAWAVAQMMEPWHWHWPVSPPCHPALTLMHPPPHPLTYCLLWPPQRQEGSQHPCSRYTAEPHKHILAVTQPAQAHPEALGSQRDCRPAPRTES